MTDGPYARLYLALVDDEKFVGIYDDDRHFATWARLLMIAEPSWPSSANLPRSARMASVRALEKAGLVVLLPGDRYRISGLDAEREGRMRETRNGGSVRAESAERDQHGRFLPSTAGTTAGSSAGTTAGDQRVQLAKPSQAEYEPSPAQPSARAPEDPADAYWSLTGRYPQGKVLAWIDDLAGQYGSEATIKAIVQAHIADASTSTLLGRAQDTLRAEARALDRQEKADEQERLREKRSQPKPLTGPDAEFKAMLEARYAAQKGAA